MIGIRTDEGVASMSGYTSLKPRTALVLALTAAAVAGFAVASPAFSQTPFSLTGSETPTQISGYAGTPFTLGGSDNGHAIYGVRSLERRDNPCYISALIEDINYSADHSGDPKDLCGSDPTSSEIKVQFGTNFADRTFVSALRVCLNNDGTRIKGFQIRGRRIDANGGVSDLPARYPDSSDSSGLTPQVDLNAPQDERANCDINGVWKRWVECPEGQIATAIVAHYEAGDTPRSVTGIGLKCRAVSG